MADPRAKLANLLQNNQTDEKIKTIISAIQKWENERKERKCRCGGIAAIVAPLFEDLNISAAEQHYELIETRAAANYYERKISKTLEEAEKAQREISNKLQNQYEVIDRKIKDLIALQQQTQSTQADCQDNSKPSYAMVATKKQDEAPPVLLIDSIDPSVSSIQIRDTVRNLHHEGKFEVKPSNVILTQKNRLVIKMKTRDLAEKAASEIETHLSEKSFKIQLPKIKRQKLQIRNIPNEISTEELMSELNHIYTHDNKFFNINYEYPASNGFRAITLEVDAASFRSLLQTERLCINFVSLPIVPYIRIIRCKKCQSFGHHISRCQFSFYCEKCSLEHPTDKCNSKNTACINCKSADLPFNHSANSNKCKMFKQEREDKLAEIWQSINYIPQKRY